MVAKLAADELSKRVAITPPGNPLLPQMEYSLKRFQSRCRGFGPPPPSAIMHKFPPNLDNYNLLFPLPPQLRSSSPELSQERTPVGTESEDHAAELPTEFSNLPQPFGG
jgi:hypothetical protein